MKVRMDCMVLMLNSIFLVVNPHCLPTVCHERTKGFYTPKCGAAQEMRVGVCLGVLILALPDSVRYSPYERNASQHCLLLLQSHAQRKSPFLNVKFGPSSGVEADYYDLG